MIDCPETERKLAELLGFSGEKQGEGNVDERVLKKFDIDCGVEILNPIQPGAYQMEPERLKEAYGDKICFWGGIDTQHLLTEGTAEQIKAEVTRILSVLDVNGGYIFSSAHTIQQDVPAENLVAMFDGTKEYYLKRG